MLIQRYFGRVVIISFYPITVNHTAIVRLMARGSCLSPLTVTRPRPAVATGGANGLCFPRTANNPSPRVPPWRKLRYPEEREKQRRTLLADPEATSWRHALKPSSAPHQTINPPPHELLGGKAAPSARAVEGDKKDDGSAISTAAASAVEKGGDATPLRSPAADLDISVPSNASPTCAAETSASVCVAPTASRAAAGDCCAEPNVEKSEGCSNHEGERAGPREEGMTESEDCGVLEEEEEEDDGKQGGKSFVCSVVPLSLALGQLGLATVDLLKVDVEGDELSVLRGINDEDWLKIHQARRLGLCTT